MRKIRKVLTYICCTCFRTFPAGGEAKAHWREKHYKPKPKRPRGRPKGS